jgi:uncharacterized protein (TIGR02996 family)
MAHPEFQFGAEELRLLAAIHADPRNDGPRLVYAEWLERAGEPAHAEFIRLQCQEPYVAIANRDYTKPGPSFSFDFPYDDPDARARQNRLLHLLPVVYNSARYARQRKLLYYEEHFRGLPLVHVGDEDYEEIADGVLAEIGELSRIDLSVRTGRLPELLSHPLMARVDKLSIWPPQDWEAGLDADSTFNSQYDRFWAENIPVLAASQVIDRLIELRPCGCHSTGELTVQSEKNLALCTELLEPRVFVEYSY